MPEKAFAFSGSLCDGVSESPMLKSESCSASGQQDLRLNSDSIHGYRSTVHTIEQTPICVMWSLTTIQAAGWLVSLM